MSSCGKCAALQLPRPRHVVHIPSASSLLKMPLLCCAGCQEQSRPSIGPGSRPGTQPAQRAPLLIPGLLRHACLRQELLQVAGHRRGRSRLCAMYSRAGAASRGRVHAGRLQTLRHAFSGRSRSRPSCSKFSAPGSAVEMDLPPCSATGRAKGSDVRQHNEMQRDRTAVE